MTLMDTYTQVIYEIDIEKVKAELGGWPATAADINRASEYVSDDIVTTETRDDMIERVRDYCAAGCTESVIYPLMDNIEDVIDALAEAKAET